MTTLAGQPPDTKKLDSLFTTLAARQLAMGGIAIAKNGRIIDQRSFGAQKITKNTGYDDWKDHQKHRTSCWP